MGKIFDFDSPFMRVLSRMADIVCLNLLTMVCCIPIITIGAALTAQHYVVLKMVRNEEGYLVRSFFKSFKENFRQATCIWLIFFAFIVLFAADIYLFLYSGMEFPKFMIIVVCAVAIIVAMIGVYVFPLLSKFDNTVRNTIKNAFMISVISLPKTLAMLIIYALPIGLLCVSFRLLPITVLFGCSGTAYLCAMLYDGTFKKFEPEEETEEEIEAEQEVEAK